MLLISADATTIPIGPLVNSAGVPQGSHNVLASEVWITFAGVKQSIATLYDEAGSTVLCETDAQGCAQLSLAGWPSGFNSFRVDVQSSGCLAWFEPNVTVLTATNYANLISGELGNTAPVGIPGSGSPNAIMQGLQSDAPVALYVSPFFVPDSSLGGIYSMGTITSNNYFGLTYGNEAGTISYNPTSHSWQLISAAGIWTCPSLEGVYIGTGDAGPIPICNAAEYAAPVAAAQATAANAALGTPADGHTIAGDVAGLPAAVWAYTTRTLSSFGMLASDTATAVASALASSFAGIGSAITTALANVKMLVVSPVVGATPAKVQPVSLAQGYQFGAYQTVLAVVDAEGNDVALTGRALEMVFADAASPTVELFAISTAGSGDDRLTVDPDHANQVDVAIAPAHLQQPRAMSWVLWDVTGPSDPVGLLSGSLVIGTNPKP